MSNRRSDSACLVFPSHHIETKAALKGDEFEIAGSSAAMRHLRMQVRRIGPHFRTVLVSGETGTGKELTARALHGMSKGADGPFVVSRAGALDDALAEFEELRDGRWMASGDPLGCLVRMAHGGTLFLDKVGEMSIAAQGRLLRVLKGHDVGQRYMLRVIASTSEDLGILASAGRFLKELYERLAMVEIVLPPLRERMEDIPELARYFLDGLALQYGSAPLMVADHALERMERYQWPGNVSELERVLRCGALRSEGPVIESYHLPVFAEESMERSPKIEAAGSLKLQDMVEQHVLRVLKDCAGNKLRAAELLGISRSTLYRMLDTCAVGDRLRP